MVLLKKEEYPEIESGEYVSQLVEVKETRSQRNPQFGPSIRFAFRILEQPYVNAVVSGLASAKLLEGNKLDKWLGGLGYEVEIGKDIETDKVVGRIVRVFVEREEGSKYTNVKHIYALREKDKPRIDANAKLMDSTIKPTAAATPAVAPTAAPTPAPVAAPTPAPVAAPAPVAPEATPPVVTPATPPVVAPATPPVTQPTQPRNIPF